MLQTFDLLLDWYVEVVDTSQSVYGLRATGRVAGCKHCEHDWNPWVVPFPSLVLDLKGVCARSRLQSGGYSRRRAWRAIVRNHEVLISGAELPDSVVVEGLR